MPKKQTHISISGSQKYVRSSVQKLADVAAVVKGLPVRQMRLQLGQMNKDAARRILETLNQAVANASHNYGMSEDALIVEHILILRGPHYKRMRPVSRGQGHAILKKTSHIVVKLKPMQKVEKAEAVKVEDAPVKATEATAPVAKKTTKKTTKKAVQVEKEA